MLALDLGVFHRRAHAVSVREALVWTFVWIFLSLLFNVGVYFWFGPDRALEFLTGYVLEKALSVDNIFVFLVILSSFSVPAALQHRVLFWGILGAMILRGVFIFAGAALLQSFHWVIYLFGAFLIFTGAKLLTRQASEITPQNNPIYKMLLKRGASPFLLVLVAVEITDIAFAFDSIPAIFAVTRDPFIVYTSNIFAILGLRALYFVLAGVMTKFRYLNAGLALVLAFVGAKMLVGDFYKVPIGWSLAVVAGILFAAVAASVLNPNKA